MSNKRTDQKMTETKPLQVQIQVLGPDGGWFTPASQPAAALAALQAIRADIAEWPASYEGKLREIRDAAQQVIETVTPLLRADASEQECPDDPDCHGMHGPDYHAPSTAEVERFVPLSELREEATS